MKNSFKRTVLTVALAMLSLFCLATVHADDGVFTVSEGASPWSDRIGQWSLTNVPDELKGSGPLPQGECSSRSLEVPGKPSSITLGVQTNDAAKFTSMFPTAKDTGTQMAVKNPGGTTMPYMIFTLANPPVKIDGAGVFGAGLLLLKIGGGWAAAVASPSASASQ